MASTKPTTLSNVSFCIAVHPARWQSQA